MKLDRRDLEILRQLQGDGSVTAAELARRLEISPPALQKRLRKLTDSGILRGTVALVAREAVGLDLLCFVHVTLAHHQTDTVQGFRDALRSMPEVLECYLLTGEFDYLIKVVAPGHRELEGFLIERLTALPGVDKIRSSIVLNEIKSSTALPLDHLGANPRRGPLADGTLPEDPGTR
jgi:DNA-binding Lrp family transcriptional regulator